MRWSDLVNCSCYRALQNHLQHLGVRLFFVCGNSQLVSFFLHVFDSHLNRGEVKLQKESKTKNNIMNSACEISTMAGQKIHGCYSAK